MWTILLFFYCREDGAKSHQNTFSDDFENRLKSKVDLLIISLYQWLLFNIYLIAWLFVFYLKYPCYTQVKSLKGW